MDIVPKVHSTLLSGVYFSDADCVTILDKEGINIYDVKTIKIIFSKKSVLSGYLIEEELWRIPLKGDVQNVNTNTFLIQLLSPNKAISRLFELPSTKKIITYYHAAAVFLTKEILTDAILAGNYDTWPGLSVKLVNKYFSESDETQNII